MHLPYCGSCFPESIQLCNLHLLLKKKRKLVSPRPWPGPYIISFNPHSRDDPYPTDKEPGHSEKPQRTGQDSKWKTEVQALQTLKLAPSLTPASLESRE